MKKNIIKVFIFLIIIGSIYCLYTKYNKYQMLKEMDDSIPIVFAAELEDGNKGTFKYNIKTGEYEKISDYIFQELSYNDNNDGVLMKKRTMKLFFFIIFILCVVCLYKVYINYKMIKEIIKQPPIVFSARFKDGDKGTFKYDIQTKKAEKISDYAFQELSYSNDYEKIVGVVWEDRFQGLAELDMKDYTLRSIISLKDLNKCVKEVNLKEIEYDGPGVTQLRMPKYYKDGYTFFWGYYSTAICYIREEDGKWNIRILNNTDSTGHNYFLKKEPETLFLETEKPFVENKTETGIIIKKTIDKDDEIVLVDGTDENALIDMPDDMSKIVYYNEPKIYMYNLETDKNDYISSQYLIWQHMLYLKLSSDGRYLFYTVGDIPFFWSDYYRMNFFIVDTKTGNKVNLNRWEKGDRFYGIDW